MQESVQKLLVGWRGLDNRLGFGVGLAMGPATVGRIGPKAGSTTRRSATW